MSYKAIVYNVMIASPGDVSEEREVVRTVIQKWNNLHAKTTSRILMPLDWENHASPSQGQRAQESINNQVLIEADILTGIFWKRIGTPTGEFESGTIEEIEKHIKAGRKTMLYFSTKSHDYTPDEYAQRKKVLDLKTQYQKNGLTWDFSSANDFKEILTNHLTLALNNTTIFKGYEETVSEILVTSTSVKARISNDAFDILKKMEQSPDGKLTIIRISGNFIVIHISSVWNHQTTSNRENQRIFFQLEELEDNGLIRQTTKDFYEITEIGYQYVESNK